MNVELKKHGNLKRELIINPEPSCAEDKKAVLPFDENCAMSFDREICVEATVSAHARGAEGLQSIVSQWQVLERFSDFDCCHAVSFTNLDTIISFGAIFDGRYIYYSSQYLNGQRCASFARCDTHKNFASKAAWESYKYEAQEHARGFYGVVFDGRYIYYIPRYYDNDNYVLRYDTKMPFADDSAWESVNIGKRASFQGGAFDGRYIYLVPGYDCKSHGDSSNFTRYDTRKDFQSLDSWESFAFSVDTGNFDGAVFDGRYIYLVPLKNAVVARYDTFKAFDNAASYEFFDGSELSMYWNVGAIFDGKYVYFCAYGQSNILRYDTGGDFSDKSSWEHFDSSNVKGVSSAGYDGGFFDGKYVYFLPFLASNKGPEKPHDDFRFHGNFIRYDVTGDFSDPDAWEMADSSLVSGLKTRGYNAGASDGRYLYWAPTEHEEGLRDGKLFGHGNYLRVDTLGNNATFNLRFADYGHNGGLGGAVPGVRFLVNTDKGVISIAANRILEAGEYSIKAQYDGRKISLYINDELINSQEADGSIVNSLKDICLGHQKSGTEFFKGEVKQLIIRNFV